MAYSPRGRKELDKTEHNDNKESILSWMKTKLQEIRTYEMSLNSTYRENLQNSKYDFFKGLKSMTPAFILRN